MKKLNLRLFIICSAIALAGCTTTTSLDEPDVVYKTRLVPITVPNHLIEPIPVPTPPARNEYIYADAEDKEGMLTDYSIALLKALNDANLSLKSVREFMARQTDLFKSK